MNKESIYELAQEFTANSKFNYVHKEIAIKEELIGMKIYEEPIFAFGSALMKNSRN